MEYSVTLVPELGPAFGRLTRAPAAGTGRIPLDDLRLELVTTMFEHAATARAFTGDPAAAASALNRAAWLGAWENAVAAAAARIGDHIDRQLQAAAEESRLPAKRRTALPLTAADRRAIAARLGGGSLPLLRSLDALERTVPAVSARGARGEAGLSEWQEALLGVARRLESAWLGLEGAASREPSVWAPAIEEIRAWRRPVWPVWTLTAAVVLLVVYVGLVFGGYLPAVGPIGELAQAWWYRG
jgi:hypothetical protein